MNRAPLRVAIAGLGAIGWAVARALDGGVPGLVLAAASAGDPARAAGRVATLRTAVPVVSSASLAEQADVIVECAPPAAFLAIAEPALRQGRILMPLSVGALLDHPELVALAEASGGRIIVPTGALLGLDAVRAAAEGEITAAKIITAKPPAGLAGAPYLVERGITLSDLRERVKLFEGSAREGARGFPANVNVAAALSIAGIGPDRTRLEIWADPMLTRNTHTVIVESDAARLTMTIENVPSENPRTGRITAQSVIACLRALVSPLRVGS